MRPTLRAIGTAGGAGTARKLLRNGPEDAPVHGDAEPPPHVAGEEIGLWTLSIAVLRLEIDRAARRTAWHDVDDAAHRVVAVQAGARSVHDLDAVGALERHARPIHP